MHTWHVETWPSCLYASKEDIVKEKAMSLPEHGIPPEVIRLLPNDSSHDKLQIQKAATPVEGRHKPEEAARMIAEQRPNHVVLEKSSDEGMDLNERFINSVSTLGRNLEPSVPKRSEAEFRSRDNASAGDERSAVRGGAAKRVGERSPAMWTRMLTAVVRNRILELSAVFWGANDLRSLNCASDGISISSSAVARDLHDEVRSGLVDCIKDCHQIYSHQYIVSTGSHMMNQFEPWYFGVAFAFCFKYCVGMPDMPSWSKTPKHRRGKDDPIVDLSTWVRVMTRRAEMQLRRDWMFGFTMGSVLFRSLVNQSRAVYSYVNYRKSDGTKGFSAKDLEEGAISICRALDGHCIDPANPQKKIPVNGDLTKVRWATCLSEAGKRLLQNIEHTSSRIPGTMEVRKLMRFATHAGRISKGVPEFVTWSPDEKHDVLMLRLSRSRRKDPLKALDVNDSAYGSIHAP